MFGLKESDAAELARVLAREDLSRDAARETVARALWTGIVEPGDHTAGLLVSALGAAPALALVAEGRTAADVLVALADADGGGTGGGASPGSTGASPGEGGLERAIATALARWRPRLMPSSALAALRRAERIGARLLVPSSVLSSASPLSSAPALSNPLPDGSFPVWPEGLTDLGFHAPLALWCRGTDRALVALRDSIALVGARAATGYGEHVTMEASAGLVDRGYAIVSGAAYGIDGMAHRAALASDGVTVAFLAGGVDRFYPSGHDALLTRIVETGAVMSELPCGEPPTKWRFLQRNRLIAAASRATVVLEAGWRSGSLNTAGHAAGLTRPLGAVPGPVTSAASAGCHRLIRDFDAVCVTNADEMADLAPIAPISSSTASNDSLQLSGLEAPASVPLQALGDRPSLQVRVLDALSTRSPRSSVEVATRCGLAASTVQAILGVLALENKVTEHDGGWIVR